MLALVFVAAFVTESAAQLVPPTAQPGRERERFVDPTPVPVQPVAPRVTLPSTVAPEGAETIGLTIRRVQVSGATVYDAAELEALYRDLIGRRATLADVYDIARRITAKYGADGYVLSRAVVPPQELDPAAAVVVIRVVEGFVSRVEWPAKLSGYRDFFTHYAARITADRPVNIRTIERYLLLGNDLPGLKFTTALRAADGETGAAVLVVEVEEKRIEAVGRVDNRGSPARGPIQFLSQATVNNLFGNHSAFTFAYAGASPQRELQFVAPSWRQVLTAEGLTAFVNGSYSWGRPGLSALTLFEFKTNSTIVEAGLSYPLLRSRERSVIFTALMFGSDSTSEFGDVPNNRDRLRGFRLRGEAALGDRFGGTNQFSATVSQGIEGLGSTSNDNQLASRQAGRVDFTKIELFASRLQPLGHGLSLLLAAYGQYAATSLLTPEQCGYGGRFFGRAYDPSQLLGDHCWATSAELRFDLPRAVAPASESKSASEPASKPDTVIVMPRAQVYAFADAGRLYTISPAFGTSDSVRGASAGGGLRLGWEQYFNIDLSAAKAIDGPRDDWRFFFIATARY